MRRKSSKNVIEGLFSIAQRRRPDRCAPEADYLAKVARIFGLDEFARFERAKAVGIGRR